MTQNINHHVLFIVTNIWAAAALISNDSSSQLFCTILAYIYIMMQFWELNKLRKEVNRLKRELNR